MCHNFTTTLTTSLRDYLKNNTVQLIHMYLLLYYLCLPFSPMLFELEFIFQILS
uniref:Uncharacterized protein n=1 Tax=Anguilla anguilla TaxID=7936 RepID=A0A0E9WBB4_ANGAN